MEEEQEYTERELIIGNMERLRGKAERIEEELEELAKEPFLTSLGEAMRDNRMELLKQTRIALGKEAHKLSLLP